MITEKLKAPSEFEIAEAQARLENLKKSRESARAKLINQFQNLVESIPKKLSYEDAVNLYDIIEKKMTEKSTGHRKIRGHPVPDDLRKTLENALSSNQYTFAQMEDMFGVSVSYLAKLKKKLGLTRARQAVA